MTSKEEIRNNAMRIRNAEIWQLDTVAATIVLLVAILLFPLRFFVSQILVETVPLVLGAASIVFLGIKYLGNSDATFTGWYLSEWSHRLLGGLTIVGLGALVSVGILTGARTVPFFLVGSAVGTLLLVQIVFAPESGQRPGFVLAELVVFGVILRGTALATTPELIGVDTWTHVTEYAAAIQQSGSVAAISNSRYYTAPLYHLLVVLAAELFHSSLRVALYVVLGLVVPFSTVLIYFTARYFISTRWALFAVAVYSIGDHVVRWGIEIIPTSMGVVFFLAIFYGVTRTYVSQNRRPMYALVMFFSLATIFTHQISAFIVLVFLGTGMAVQIAYRYVFSSQNVSPQYDGRTQVNFAGLFVFALAFTLANWTLAPDGDQSFLFGIVDLFQRQFTTYAGFLNLASNTAIASGAIQSLTVSVPISVALVDSLGFLLLLLFTLIGSFTLLQQTRLNGLQLVWILSAGVMFFVALGMPMFGIYTFVPNRWFAFLYVPMALATAFGAMYLASRHPSRAVIAGLLVFALVFPGGMVVAHKATPENPVFDDYYPRFGYSESELRAAATISSIHPDDTTIQTDHPYWTLFERRQQDDRVTGFELTNDGTVAADSAIYRDYQTEEAPQARYDGTLLSVKLAHESVCGPTSDTVYSIGTVQYCRYP